MVIIVDIFFYEDEIIINKLARQYHNTILNKILKWMRQSF